MPRTNNKPSLNNKNHKPFIIFRFLIYLDKSFSIYFWKFLDIFACKNIKIANLYEKAIGKQYIKEYDQFGLLKYNKILHIGCGAYPLTEITLANSSNIKVVGIDKNPDAVVLAKEIIRRKKLEKKVTIIDGDGINYSADGFDVVIISSCSTPKEKVLENIFKKANRNSIIIVRTVNSALNNILEHINENKDIKYVKQLYFSTFFLKPNFWYSIYLTKK